MIITLSEIDKQRFGVITAIAKNVADDDIEPMERFCADNAVEMCIVRIMTTDLPVMQKLEDLGYRTMDTLVYYAFKFAKKDIPADNNVHHIRASQASDIPDLVQVATDSFKGYYGHYHADPRLPDHKCDDVYIDWAKKSVQSRDFADEVFVVVDDANIQGFATLRYNSDTEGEGVLFGVAPQAQGKGIYRSMMLQGMRWSQAQGHHKMVVSTQITNIAVQKVWARLGFEMDHSYYTLHKWF